MRNLNKRMLAIHGDDWPSTWSAPKRHAKHEGREVHCCVSHPSFYSSIHKATGCPRHGLVLQVPNCFVDWQTRVHVL